MAEKTVRLKFDGGAGAFEDRGTTFEAGGPSKEVSAERAEVLLALADYDFREATDDELKAEADEEAAAQAYAEAVAETTADTDAAEEKAAADRAVFYGAESQAEIDAAGLTEDEAPRPATADGIQAGAEAEAGADDEEAEAEERLQAEIEAEIEPDEDAGEPGNDEAKARARRDR